MCEKFEFVREEGVEEGGKKDIKKDSGVKL